MPPPAIKTVKALIFYQYAKVIASSAGFSKEKNKAVYYKFLMDKMSKLSNGEIKMSSVLRCQAASERNPFPALKNIPILLVFHSFYKNLLFRNVMRKEERIPPL